MIAMPTKVLTTPTKNKFQELFIKQIFSAVSLRALPIIQNHLRQITRATLGLQIDLSNVFSNNTCGQQLKSTNCPQRNCQARPSRHCVPSKMPDKNQINIKILMPNITIPSRVISFIGFTDRDEIPSQAKESIFLRGICSPCKSLCTLVVNHTASVTYEGNHAPEEQVDFLIFRQCIQRPAAHQAIIRMIEHHIRTQGFHDPVEPLCGYPFKRCVSFSLLERTP